MQNLTYISKISTYLCEKMHLKKTNFWSRQIFSEELHTMTETLGFSSPLSDLYKEKREHLKKECYQHFVDQSSKCGFEKCFSYYGLEDFKQLCQVRFLQGQ
jgi:hypothetical protein